ncbi:hypothetical protein HFP15_30120 [Amycolatopsis sp. K13G38]|uniref:Uncharacterized protein n=1 Tax=Amycolatopsis acididurans TaxID=2724524 RepID=A0ABX1JBG3_9PSEU|nr:hypothetical protein [Amycolatopsis acididurans]NKQ57135.1 hypothetical protein [Amycolatopsis acididurans]
MNGPGRDRPVHRADGINKAAWLIVVSRNVRWRAASDGSWNATRATVDTLVMTSKHATQDDLIVQHCREHHRGHAVMGSFQGNEVWVCGECQFRIPVPIHDDDE